MYGIFNQPVLVTIFDVHVVSIEQFPLSISVLLPPHRSQQKKLTLLVGMGKGSGCPVVKVRTGSYKIIYELGNCIHYVMKMYYLVSLID